MVGKCAPAERSAAVSGAEALRKESPAAGSSPSLVAEHNSRSVTLGWKLCALIVITRVLDRPAWPLWSG